MASVDLDCLYFYKACKCFLHLSCRVICRFFTFTFASIYINQHIHCARRPINTIDSRPHSLWIPGFRICYRIVFDCGSRSWTSDFPGYPSTVLKTGYWYKAAQSSPPRWTRTCTSGRESTTTTPLGPWLLCKGDSDRKSRSTLSHWNASPWAQSRCRARRTLCRPSSGISSRIGGGYGDYSASVPHSSSWW